jgi:hypothetical protein
MKVKIRRVLEGMQRTEEAIQALAHLLDNCDPGDFGVSEHEKTQAFKLLHTGRSAIEEARTWLMP